MEGRSRNSFELATLARKLGVGVSVLHVGAHPDDEDVGLLAYVSRRHFAQVAYWSATRGESGQNSVNHYRGKALGVFRTWESLAAGKLDGAERLYGPFADFGFSKNAKEAFSRWGKENLVRELVYLIRLFQPTVIVSKWSGTPADGHGHHQAVGQALKDAFHAAASEEMFAEHFGLGLGTWRTAKFYTSTDNALNPATRLQDGKENPSYEKDGYLRMNTGEFDPMMGCSYQEQAWRAYNCHQSQSIGIVPYSGNFFHYFRLVKSMVPTPPREYDIFCGIDSSLKGILRGTEISGDCMERFDFLGEVQRLTDEAVARLGAGDPMPAGRPLAEAVSLLRSAREDLLGSSKSLSASDQSLILKLESKICDFENVTVHCLGLRLEAGCTRSRVTPGESVWLSAKLLNPRKVALSDVTFSVHVPQKWHVEDYSPDRPGQDSAEDPVGFYELLAGEDADLSSPYWLIEPSDGFVYQCGKTGHLAFGPEAVRVGCEFRAKGTLLRASAPAVHKKAFDGGYSELSLRAIPPISLHPQTDRKFLLISDQDQHFEIRIRTHCNDEERPARGILRLTGPDGWTVAPEYREVNLTYGKSVGSAFRITIPAGTTEGDYPLEFIINCRGRDYNIVCSPVRWGTPGLPVADDPATCREEELLLNPAVLKVHMINAEHVRGLRYAYIEGVKEEMPEVLESVGVHLHTLSAGEIVHGDLNSFDTIIVGPRAFNLKAKLQENTQRFHEFMEKGGTLLVQYHWTDFDKGSLAPYPLRMRQPVDRVTNENSAVGILKPESALFHFPNRIGQAEFQCWVHDRGLGFMHEWDERYETCLACSDPGEPPMEGGLLQCRHGKGHFLYVAYSLFRQLPAGVHGAFRLFFNMLALGHSGKGA